MRPSGRAPDQLRPVSLEPGFSRHAEGSCLVKFGDTHVLVTATLEDRLPPWLKGQGRGWVTAEYGMLPRSTHTRRPRGRPRKQSGRTGDPAPDRPLAQGRGRPHRHGRAADQHRLRRPAGRRRHAHAAITGSWVALHFASSA